MEDRYRDVTDKFYEIYRPLQKKYNLRYNIHSSLYDDGLIEIWEYHGETKGKCICRVKEPEIIDCYERVIEYLREYKKEKGGTDIWEKCSRGSLTGWGLTKTR